MANSNQFIHDPDEVLDYTINWATYLSAISDTISASEWAIDTPDSGLTIESTANTTTTATAWLSGGSDNHREYSVRNRITTAGGRTADRSIVIKTRSK